MKDEATIETCPRHIWMHSVQEELARAGFNDPELAAGGGPLRDRLNRAYNAGEAVWMIVDEIVLRLRQRKLVAASWENGARRACLRALRSTR